MSATDRPFYGSFAWAYDHLNERPVGAECADIARTLSERRLPRDARLLDAGCGTGRYSVALAALGYRVTGVDASAALLDVARQRVGASAVVFVEGDLRRLPAEPPFDAILCRGVLNDVIEDADRRDVFRSFAEALRPGGVLVFDVREWEATVRRKHRQPVYEKTVQTDRGVLTFRSDSRLDPATRQLRLAERHVLTAGGITTAAVYDFVMRCWTGEEIEELLAQSHFAAPEFRLGYAAASGGEATDRLVVTATRS